MFLQAIGVDNTENLTPSTLCRTVASVQNSMKLINCANFALVFMYTYMVLYHTEFIMNHQNKFFSIFLGFFWAVGIFMMIIYVGDKDTIVKNSGECETRNVLLVVLYVGYYGITLISQIYTITKIYFKIKDITDDEDADRKNKWKLYVLGSIQLGMSMIVPLFFFNQYNPIVIVIRISFEIIKSFIFITFYAYDEETIITLKEVFLCKKPETTDDEEDINKFKELK